MKRKEFRKLHLGQPTRLTAGLTPHEHPAVSPDGRLLAYYAGEYGAIHIYTADLRGRLARRLSPNGGNSTQPAWHPSGLAVAYRHQHSIDSKWELWETALNGDTAPRCLLADRQYHYKHPYYDPTGARLAYFSDEGSPGVFHIWVLDLPTGQKKQLTAGNTQMHCHPVFSPDGGRILYHAYRGTDESATPPVTNLYELDLASGAVRELTSGEDQFKHPFYLTNNVVTYHHERNSDGRRRLCAMHLRDCEIIALTSGKNNDKHPFPWIDRQGRMWLAWSSKKLGAEIAGESKSFDIFIAALEV
jgi:Tol biopolymer transport system component